MNRVTCRRLCLPVFLLVSLFFLSCAGSGDNKIIRVPALMPPIYAGAFRSSVVSLKKNFPASMKRSRVILRPFRNRTARHLDTGVMTTLLLRELVAEKFNVSREQKKSPGEMKKLPSPCSSFFYLGGSLQEVKKSLTAGKEKRREYHRYTLLTLILEEACTGRVVWMKTLTFLEVSSAEPKITF